MTALSLIAIAIFAKHLCDLVRAIRYYQWKKQRDNLTLEQFVQSLECEYYRAKMKEKYRD